MRAHRLRIDHRHLVLVARVGILDRPAGLEIDALGPGDDGEFLGADQLSGRAVEHIEEAVLRCMHQDVAQLAPNFQVSQGHVCG